MRFLCLIHTAPADVAAIDAATHRQIVADHFAFDAGLEADGTMIVSEALEEPEHSLVIRRRTEGTVVTDGPFSEAKEHIGGFYLIEAADLAAAVEIASGIPSLAHSSVEVRPVRTLTLEDC